MRRRGEGSSPGCPFFRISFEFFPAKTVEAESSLWQAVRRLEPLAPSFVSVTYGAGGSTRANTYNTVLRILRETSLVPAAHLTCVSATRAEVDAVADDYWNAGIRHVVALRGDPPGGGEQSRPYAGGYQRAAELVSGLRKRHPFEISVAAYPEGHPESPSVEADIENLKQKVDGGATRAITQFFFDNDQFLRFRDSVKKAGVSVPVVPGIMPITNFSQMVRFAEKSKVTVPAFIREALVGVEQDSTRQLVAARLATEQVGQLAREGVTDFHFYTLNRAELSRAICRRLGLRPALNGSKSRA